LAARFLSAGAIVLTQLWSTSAEARKFDFSNERLATSIGGTYGLSSLGGGSYEGSAGLSTEFGVRPQYQYSGEFAVILASERFAFKMGAEVLSPQRFTSLKGQDQAQTDLLELKSSLLVFAPHGMLEYRGAISPTHVMVLGFGGGMAFFDLDNEYIMTTTGATQYGLSQFSERASGQMWMAKVWLGTEFLLSDVATLLVGIGYRYVPPTTLKAKSSWTGFQGAVAEGDVLKTDTGTDRRFDISGAFATLALRVYLF
jgi:hypothetical protein